MRFLRYGVLIVVLLLCQFVQGCHPVFSTSDAGTKPQLHDQVPRIEIETDGKESDLPCRVVFRRDENSRKILWEARFEQGFCARKAEETRNVLRVRGWDCLSVEPVDRDGDIRHVAAAWRCLQQEQQAVVETTSRLPIPEPRPPMDQGFNDHRIDAALKMAVEDDLSNSILRIAGQSTISAVAQGDLDGNGSNDAVIVLTNSNNQGRKHLLLMAYLGDGQSYSLTDTYIAPIKPSWENGDAVVAINEGVIELSVCCPRTDRPTLLSLRGRKLTFDRR